MEYSTSDKHNNTCIHEKGIFNACCVSEVHLFDRQLFVLPRRGNNGGLNKESYV